MKRQTFEYSVEFFDELFIGEHHLFCNDILIDYTTDFYIPFGKTDILGAGYAAVVDDRDSNGIILRVLNIVY